MNWFLTWILAHPGDQKHLNNYIYFLLTHLVSHMYACFKEVIQSWISCVDIGKINIRVLLTRNVIEGLISE